MKAGSGLTLMLVFSAVDLLTAALVCGVVLFIVLAGAHGPLQASEETLSGAAPMLVEIVSMGTDPSASPRLSVRGVPIRVGAEADSVVWAGVPVQQGAARLSAFLIGGNASRFQVMNLTASTVISVQSGNHGKSEFLLRCLKFPWTATLVIERPADSSDTCTQRQTIEPIANATMQRAMILQERGISAPAPWGKPVERDSFGVSLLENNKGSIAIPANASLVATW